MNGILHPDTPLDQRVVLRRVGRIDPERIESYLLEEGYHALRRALTRMTPDEVIGEVVAAGLRGHGGAGFPTGMKWRFTASEPGPIKYVVCNADESEPGTFKDRLIMEGDPHSIVEAMVIAGYAIGASEGYIYIRGEYRLAQERIARAIRQAREGGFLGRDILGCGLNFDIHVHSGAGAYICGEETALLESLEGKRGTPRSKPPHPTTCGLWGRPTLVNNVETLANVPPILLHGASWFRHFGTPGSPGTQVFTLLGDVNRRGAVEAPLGVTIRELVEEYGQGVRGTFKLVQCGGSSGSVVPASMQDTALDFDSHRTSGVTLGSGAILVCNDRTCVVDLARVVMKFFREESCGKCVPCRVGTVESHQILERICRGNATPRDLDTLTRLAEVMQHTSFCGLGQSAPTVVTSTLRYFRDEYEAHVNERRCPAGVCRMDEHPPRALAEMTRAQQASEQGA